MTEPRWLQAKCACAIGRDGLVDDAVRVVIALNGDCGQVPLVDDSSDQRCVAGDLVRGGTARVAVQADVRQHRGRIGLGLIRERQGLPRTIDLLSGREVPFHGASLERYAAQRNRNRLIVEIPIADRESPAVHRAVVVMVELDCQLRGPHIVRHAAPHRSVGRQAVRLRGSGVGTQAELVDRGSQVLGSREREGQCGPGRIRALLEMIIPLSRSRAERVRAERQTDREVGELAERIGVGRSIGHSVTVVVEFNDLVAGRNAPLRDRTVYGRIRGDQIAGGATGILPQSQRRHDGRLRGGNLQGECQSHPVTC